MLLDGHGKGLLRHLPFERPHARTNCHIRRTYCTLDPYEIETLNHAICPGIAWNGGEPGKDRRVVNAAGLKEIQQELPLR